jgi:hypothetical protein
LGLCCKEILFFRNLFTQFLTVKMPTLQMKTGPSIVEEDNVDAIDTADGGGKATKLRHMGHHNFFARDCQENGDCKVVKVDTEDNSADLTTKPPGSRPRMIRLLETKLNFRFNCLEPR